MSHFALPCCRCCRCLGCCTRRCAYDRFAISSQGESFSSGVHIYVAHSVPAIHVLGYGHPSESLQSRVESSATSFTALTSYIYHDVYMCVEYLHAEFLDHCASVFRSMTIDGEGCVDRALFFAEVKQIVKLHCRSLRYHFVCSVRLMSCCHNGAVC